jgi:hypothetical protein
MDAFHTTGVPAPGHGHLYDIANLKIRHCSLPAAHCAVCPRLYRSNHLVGGFPHFPGVLPAIPRTALPAGKNIYQNIEKINTGIDIVKPMP